MDLSPGRSRTKLLHAAFVGRALSYLQNLIVFARNSRQKIPLQISRPTLPLLLVLSVVIWPVPASAQLPSTIDLNSGEEDVLVYGGAAYHSLTRWGALEVGDLNGDGIDDLILGAYYAGGPSDDYRSTAGEAYVYFGAGSLAGTKDIAGTAGTAPDVTIYGATKYDTLTEDGAMAMGDLNGDGIDDLILGSQWADGPSEGRGNAGEAYIIFGSTSLPATIDLKTSDEDVTIYGASASDGLTSYNAVAVGDVNGDGTDDLILGAPAADGPAEGRANAAGEAYIIFGSSSLPATIDLFKDETDPGDQDVIIYGGSANDVLAGSHAVAVGDVNGDGIDDLILGAYYADGPSDARVNVGEAYVIFGSSSLAPIIDIAGTEPSPAVPPDVTIYGYDWNGHLAGSGIAVGDVNGDGTDDLILGAPVADGPSSTRNSAGEAYVFLGKSSLPATIDLNTSGEDVTIYGATAGDQLDMGGAAIVGDLNGDGTDDLILGALQADGPSNGRSYAGEAYVIFGKTALEGGLPATIDLNTSGEDVTIYGATAEDYLTGGGVEVSEAGLTFGDLNTDGFDDLILGAPWADGPSEGRADAGEAYVIFGSGTSTTAIVKKTDHAGDPLPEDYNMARTEIDFSSGDGNSLTTVTLTRDDSAVNLADLSKVADVTWEIGTDRTNLTADVTFDYLDSEVTGIAESKLGVLKAPTAAGPFTEVPATLDTDKNRIEVRAVKSLSSIFTLTDVRDSDGDGLLNLFETNTGTFNDRNHTGTNPFDADSDDDGLVDGVETFTEIFVNENDTGSDPNKEDSDDDGFWDGEEVFGGTDPNSPSSPHPPLPPQVVWVDFAEPGGGNGTYSQPYGSLTDACANVLPGGIIRIKGYTDKSWTNEVFPEITKVIQIEAVNGTVRIGAVSGKRAGLLPPTGRKPGLLDVWRTLLDTLRGGLEVEGYPESEGEL